MKIIAIICLSFVLKTCYCQNIFDYEHSYKYAQHLYSYSDFKSVISIINELEKEQPYNKELQIWKVKCYLKLGQIKLAQTVIHELKPDSIFEAEIQFLKVKCAILNDSFENTNYINIKTLSEATLELLCYNTYYMFGKDSAVAFCKTYLKNNNLKNYIIELLSTNPFKYKNPNKAAFMSIIPGLGQLYTNQYADGTLGIIPIYVNGALAYYAFSEYGVSSIFGWVNITIASGFYLGNIYGAFLSAKRLNELHLKKVNNEIKNRTANLYY